MSTPTPDEIRHITESLRTASKEDLITISTAVIVAGIDSQDITVDLEEPAGLDAIRDAHSGDSFQDFINGD